MLGLSRIKGSQSGRMKGDVVRKLMVQARGEEVRFLVRSLVGNLRVSRSFVVFDEWRQADESRSEQSGS